MAIELTRRGALALGLGSVAAIAAVPRAAFALNIEDAKEMIGRLVNDVNNVINSGTSESAMFVEFERLFTKYADVPIIARSALGVAARQASDAQMKAFTLAFRGYISRKYGRRFREFIGGKIIVESGKPVKSFFEVISIAHLRGEAPFEVRWHVSDKSGKNQFFNIIIEGVNMLASERTEIGAMLDRRNGDINALIADLKTAI